METFPASPPPSYVFTEKIGFKTLVSDFANGAEQRRNKWGQGKRSFTLTYDVLTAAETNTLYNFYVARKGPFEAFSFVNPMDSQTYTVRFVDDEMSYDEFDIQLRRTGVKLIQVL